MMTVSRPMIPTWPQRARAAFEHLFQPLQDIDIYVEDRHDTVFYTELFKRIAPAPLKVARVFDAGGRAAVIARAQSHDFSKRRALFLIDGDFEWVRGEAAPDPNVVYRLEAYCIENLLVHEESGARILIEEELLSEEDAKTKLGFEAWLAVIRAELLELFIAFAALNLVDHSQPTVGLGLGCLLAPAGKGIPPRLDPAKARAVTAAVRSQVEATIGPARTGELIDSIRSRITGLPNPHDVISGKDHLLPLFEFHIWSHTNRRGPRKSLRMRLARNCSLGRFKPLSEAMARASRGKAPNG